MPAAQSIARIETCGSRRWGTLDSHSRCETNPRRILVVTSLSVAVLAAFALIGATSMAQSAPAAPIVQLVARTLRTFDAPEANQGVAADRDHFYPVDNTVIAKYRSQLAASCDAGRRHRRS